MVEGLLGVDMHPGRPGGSSSEAWKLRTCKHSGPEAVILLLYAITKAWCERSTECTPKMMIPHLFPGVASSVQLEYYSNSFDDS